MTCREALSARLDGEDEQVPVEHTDGHLAGCPACRTWQAALALTRTVRGRWPRIALIGVAAAQTGLALSQLMGIGATTAHAAHSGVPLTGHLFNTLGTATADRAA